MLSQIRPAIVSLLFLTFITGVVYPAVVTGIAKMVFPGQAEGSLIVQDGKTVGSTLIGQQFTEAKYFWPRPSATGPVPYNAAAGSGSNMATSNPALVDAVKSRIDALHAADPANTLPIPVDLITASASGLDPHISLAAAEYQLSRVAKTRNLPADQVRKLIAQHTEAPALYFLGEARVNVLQLNLALDRH